MVQIMKKVVLFSFVFGVGMTLLLVFVNDMNGTIHLPRWINLLGLYLCTLSAIGYLVITVYHIFKARKLHVKPNILFKADKKDVYIIPIIFLLFRHNLDWESKLVMALAFILIFFVMKPYYDLF